MTDVAPNLFSGQKHVDLSRKVLIWRLSNTSKTDLCVEALEEELARFDPPSIMNRDQGSQVTSWAW